MHKTKQKRDRNRTTTSLVLDSSMLRGRRKFRLKPANLVAFKLSVFESRRISFLKLFLVIDIPMFYLKYLTMQGYRIFKQRRLSQAYANAQPRLSFRCLR